MAKSFIFKSVSTALIMAFVMVIAVAVPIVATMNISVEQPIGSGDRTIITADVARNGSTITLSYYSDANNNGLDDDGGSWIKIANVTDGGENDAANETRPNGFVVFSWMTPQLKPGQYLIKAEDPFGPSRTTSMLVKDYPLHLDPTVYGPNTASDAGLVKPGEFGSFGVAVSGNCRLCHITDNPTKDNPGVNVSQVQQSFSANISQITGNAGDVKVIPTDILHSSGTAGFVGWRFYASKTLNTGDTVSATVYGTNPANGLTTNVTAYAGVNKAVNIPPTTQGGSNQAVTGATSSASNTTTKSSSAASSNPLPGFEVWVVVVALTTVAYLLARKR